MKAAIRILIPLLLVLLVVSCPPIERLQEDPSVGEGEDPDGGFGTLEIDFSSIFTSPRTLVPAGMTISRCDITGTLAGGAETFTDSVAVGETFSRSALAAGVWSIAVDAVNPDGIIIGHGETTARITAGATTAAQITISPLPGPGTLDLEIRYGKKVFQTPATVQADVYPAIGGQLTLVFTPGVDGDFRTGTYLNAAVPAGYYILTVQLIGDGAVAWGITEAVRIVTGLTTQESWTYPAP